MLDDVGVRIDRLARSKHLDEAAGLAQAWVIDEPVNAKAWSKLAHVHELRRSFDEAARAVIAALTFAPNHPPYLFKLGCIEFRRGELRLAADAFERCVDASLALDDVYYLDAARIAQAQCLLRDGDANRAADALAGADSESATWLDGRVTAGELSLAIQQRLAHKEAMASRA